MVHRHNFEQLRSINQRTSQHIRKFILSHRLSFCYRLAQGSDPQLIFPFQQRQIIRRAALFQKAVQIVIASLFHGIQPVLQSLYTCDIFQFYPFHPMLLTASLLFMEISGNLFHSGSLFYMERASPVAMAAGRAVRGFLLQIPIMTGCHGIPCHRQVIIFIDQPHI